LSPDLPAVEADGGLVQQIITNLVINGAEAIGPETLGFVAVRTAVREIAASTLRNAITGDWLAEGRYVVIEVQDSGCGMDEATRPASSSHSSRPRSTAAVSAYPR